MTCNLQESPSSAQAGGAAFDMSQCVNSSKLVVLLPLCLLLLVWLQLSCASAKETACSVAAEHGGRATMAGGLPHLLSPVTTRTRMPAERQMSMAGATSGRGGSCIAAMPRKVRPASSSAVTCMVRYHARFFVRRK